MTDLLLVGERDEALLNIQRFVGAREPDWSILHSVNGSGALAQLKNRTSDIVLARLGDVDECESLFSEVGSTTPGAIRLALSESPAVRVKGAHQILAGGADLGDLHMSLRAAAKVSSHSSQHKKLQRIISRFQEVPSPPVLYFDIREQLDSAAGTAAKMAEIAGRDPALVARTLKIANSGFYARPGTVGDLADAITLMGAETLLGLVLAAHLFSGMPPPGLRLDMLWNHSFEVSMLARAICRLEEGSSANASHSFLAGLLHDIGLIVLFQNESAAYQPMWADCAGDESELARLERENFGISHGELGSMVLTLWNLPDPVVDAVAASHAESFNEPLSIVSRSVLAAEWMLSRNGGPNPDALPPALGDVSCDRLASWIEARDGLATQG
ncbi:MAG: HDOD domain-containing protein [Pseudomonadota bacterium]